MCVSFQAHTRRKRTHVVAFGSNGTKFSTHMQMHLEMVVGQIKMSPVRLCDIWGIGFRREVKKSGETTKIA